MRTARATTFAEYRRLLGQLATDEGVARGLSLELRPTDVVISPFAKCGTTWLQQIVHGLRTSGDMSFDDISRAVPWIEVGTDVGLDLAAEQVAEPRAFKSHLGWDQVPKGGRYVVSLRNPGDAAVSMYRFMEGWFIEPGAIPIDEFVRLEYVARDRGGDYWLHLLSWWAHRHDENVLLLAYEDMKADLPETVRRIAEFIGVPLDDELLEIVVRQSSLAFMTEHKSKFDDLLDRERSERVIGLPAGSDSAKVRAGVVGARTVELPPKVQAELDAVWTEVIARKLAFADYDELLAELRASR
ncbi:MAG: sulfotransferase domain-containing protein [Chloroflexi bacterium]|nr:sulfotransferase domain-containing protein [Chloroflexota bacterium]MDA1146108.1 sulfotransferase domain-containing protein [Chloroflexota bacterium]